MLRGVGWSLQETIKRCARTRAIHKSLQAQNNPTENPTGVWATEIKLVTKTKSLAVTFNTGEKFSYPAELLRVENPAATPPTDPLGRPILVAGRRDIGILSVQPIGNYAIQLQFDDLHSASFYTWDFLYDLGRHKYSRIKAYLRKLQQRGLSRDPRVFTAQRTKNH